MAAPLARPALLARRVGVVREVELCHARNGAANAKLARESFLKKNSE